MLTVVYRRELNLDTSRVFVVYVHLVNMFCQGSRGVCPAHGGTTSCVDDPNVLAVLKS